MYDAMSVSTTIRLIRSGNSERPRACPYKWRRQNARSRRRERDRCSEGGLQWRVAPGGRQPPCKQGVASRRSRRSFPIPTTSLSQRSRCEPLGTVLPALRVLQFLPSCSPLAARYARDGSRDHQSRLGIVGTVGLNVSFLSVAQAV